MFRLIGNSALELKKYKHLINNDYIEKLLNHPNREYFHAIDLYKKLITSNPLNRISAEQALKHIWFINHNNYDIITERSYDECSFFNEKEENLMNTELDKTNENENKLIDQLNNSNELATTPMLKKKKLNKDLDEKIDLSELDDFNVENPVKEKMMKLNALRIDFQKVSISSIKNKKF